MSDKTYSFMDLYVALIEAERDRDNWRHIATQLIGGAEQQIDDLGGLPPAGLRNPAWVSAWNLYDKAIAAHCATTVETLEPIVEQPTVKDSIAESLMFVVNMMNEGKADPKDVYPRGHYQGD